jgi:hypothetical protein
VVVGKMAIRGTISSRSTTRIVGTRHWATSVRLMTKRGRTIANSLPSRNLPSKPVDLERRRVVDLLDDRTPASLAIEPACTRMGPGRGHPTRSRWPTGTISS